jgi:ribosomal protein S18 acetylase RimI-like enzyme
VSVTVRVATVDDVPLLLDFMVAFNAFEHISWARDSGEPVLMRLLGDPSLGLVAVIDTVEHGPCGYAVLTWGFDLEWGGRDAFLTELYLDDRVRERGLGSAALPAIEALARAHDVRAIHLLVRPENTRAHALYRRAGYLQPPRLFLTKRLP